MGILKKMIAGRTATAAAGKAEEARQRLSATDPATVSVTQSDLGSSRFDVWMNVFASEISSFGAEVSQVHGGGWDGLATVEVRRGVGFRPISRDVDQDELTGYVVEWNDGPGYGFIQSDSGDRIFVHFSQLRVGRHLNVGQRVAFAFDSAAKKPQARSVRLSA